MSVLKSFATKFAKLVGVQVVTENEMQAVNQTIVKNHASEVFKNEEFKPKRNKKVSAVVSVETVATEPKTKVSRTRLTEADILERNEHLFNLGYVVKDEQIISYTGRPCQHKANKIYIDFKGQKQIGISFADYIAYWNKLGKMVQKTAIKEFEVKTNNKQTAVKSTAVVTPKPAPAPKVEPKQETRKPSQAELDAIQLIETQKQMLIEMQAKLDRFNAPKPKSTPRTKPAVKTPSKSKIELDANELETVESASLQENKPTAETLLKNKVKKMTPSTKN